MRLKVFLVEDEAMVAMLVEDMLRDLNHEVVAIAGRLDQAVDMAPRISVDVAILDVNLNGQQSFPIARILEQRGVPVVFATGYEIAGLPKDMANALVLQKPFESAQLAFALETALSRGASSDAHRE